MRLFSPSVLIAALLLAVPSYGDGLIYKLPKDGTTVSYKMEMEQTRGEKSEKKDGSMIVRSVGKAMKDGQKCRWIEVRMEIEEDQKNRVILAKVLIPEKHLGKGKTPIDNVKKCWLKMRDEAREVDDVKGLDGGPLPVFLSGPLKEEKKLKPKVVKTKLGKLKCLGVHGTKEYSQGPLNFEADVKSWLNDKVPFGVAYQEVTLSIDANGRKQKVSFKLTAEAVGTGAKSELADKN